MESGSHTDARMSSIDCSLYAESSICCTTAARRSWSAWLGGSILSIVSTYPISANSLVSYYPMSLILATGGVGWGAAVASPEKVTKSWVVGHAWRRNASQHRKTAL